VQNGDGPSYVYETPPPKPLRSSGVAYSAGEVAPWLSNVWFPSWQGNAPSGYALVSTVDTPGTGGRYMTQAPALNNFYPQ
jgi:hypothetical protein